MFTKSCRKQNRLFEKKRVFRLIDGIWARDLAHELDHLFLFFDGLNESSGGLFQASGSFVYVFGYGWHVPAGAFFLLIFCTFGATGGIFPQGPFFY